MKFISYSEASFKAERINSSSFTENPNRTAHPNSNIIINLSFAPFKITIDLDYLKTLIAQSFEQRILALKDVVKMSLNLNQVQKLGI